MLRVVVQKASNLPNVERFSKSDPYTKITFQGTEHKTKHIDNTLDPEWTENNSFSFELTRPLSTDDKLDVIIKDHETVGTHKTLGTVTVPLRDLVRSKKLDSSYDLVDGKGRPSLAKVYLQMEYESPEKEEKKGGGGKSGGGSGGGASDGGSSGGGGGGGGGEGGYEDEDEDEGGGMKRFRRRRSRRKLSDKPQDFQIRVKILEARNLPGQNIHPVVRVTVSNQRRETKVRRSTTKPIYNESFTFNFHTSEAELFDDMVIFEVFNSIKFRSDALLASFEMDVGSIFDMDDHAFVRKWILLSEPMETEKSGGKSGGGGGGSPAGYLKATAMVLASGDEPPLAASAPPKDDEDDIEANVLLPFGVERQPAIFNLKIYRAEDVPQMDTGVGQSIKKFFSFSFFGSKDKDKDEKEKTKLVDPFAMFSFSGKEVKTDIKYGKDTPIFNTVLRLPLQFPSMCERLKLQLWDWDRGSKNDIISTAFIFLSSISGHGDEGFLPQFGPCYVNFYGSPREFSVLPDENEDLNKGMGEGVAYRGRALVELETTLGEVIEEPVGVIQGDEVIRAEAFRPREEFKLFACFYEATMVSETDGPVEFEVSIGNYGNMMDESVAPSNTPPTNAVYDGSHYHYLPWFQEKPCVCVTSFWEDITHRLEPLNVINRRCERLQMSYDRVKQEYEAMNKAKKEKKGPSIAEEPSKDDRILAMLSSLLDNFVNELSKPLPDLKGKKNKLDNKMKSLRDKEMAFLARDARKEQAKLMLPEVHTDKEETINNLMAEMEDYLLRLKDLAFEPQNSMPDVILWMICGSKRIAYYRIPAYDLLFSKNEDASGKLCGETVELTLKYPGKKAHDIKDHPEIPAMLRIEMWLGKTADQVNWTDRKGNGDFALYAETYQNQTRLIPMTDFKDSSTFRPNWSNANGTIEMKKENFEAPPNWNMDVINNWKLSPELSLKFDSDAGHKTYLEEVFETQTRLIPGGAWPQDKVKWSDVHGDEMDIKSLKEIQCPKGWKWKHPERDWTVDKNRAVDNDGWEYALDPSIASYDPVQKAYHMSRRRRFIRKRVLVDKNAAKKRDHINAFEKEGWAYAPTFDGKFHARPRNADFVRRRRFLNKLTPKGGPIKEFPPVLRVKLKGKVKDKDAESQPNVWPRMFVTFHTPMKFQLWVYVYQARELLAYDDSGMSDPYVRVAFGSQSLATRTHHKSLCPTWDRSLVFENVQIYESLANIEKNPPSVVLELFDEDPVGKDDFLGRCMLKPVIKKDGFKPPQPGDPQEPRLLWQQIKKGEDDAGEILASCELFWVKDENTALPSVPSKGKVREGVRPIREWSAIEVLCWGVRNMKKFQLTNVTSPSVEFECNGQLMISEPIKSTKKDPNFKNPTLERKIVKLPVDPMYLPPVNIRVRDNRTFGRKPIVGVFSVKSLAKYRCQRPAQPNAITVEVDSGSPQTPPRSAASTTTPPRTPTGRKSITSPPETPITPSPSTPDKKLTAESLAEEEFDWWSKFYASAMHDEPDAGPLPPPEPDTLGLPKVFEFLSTSGQEKKHDHLQLYRMGGYDTLQIYNHELESVEGFEGFEDFVSTFSIRRGKTKSNDEAEDTVVGELKGSFRIYPMPPKDSEGKFPEVEAVFSNVMSSKPRECIVRLYVIGAKQLQPQDPNGLADPYLKVTLGKTKFDESDNYKPNTLTPMFGKMFEMKATVPLEKDLTVTVMDYDMLSRDDLIGETVIDLENRLLSKYRATCGLPQTFCRKFECSGPPHRWRDIKDPYDILKDWCATNMSGVDVKLYGAGKPSSPYRMVLGDREYSLDQFEMTAFQKRHTKGSKNRDNRKQQLALFVLDQLGLVPEHVETRPLHNPLQPGLEQGKIQLWVDIFPIDDGVPGLPVYIAPRQPSVFHLRVIIWNTTGVLLEETSVTGEKMSDIYLKAWLSGIDEKQRTDVHYRSLDGDGNFNWRMEFPFEFLPIEKMLVVKKKAHFWSKDVTEEELPPIFNVQVWDNDLFSKDDFIGQRDLNLVALDKPCAKASSCGGRNDPAKKGEKINLFKQGTINGWWALYPGEVKEKKDKKGKAEDEDDDEEDAKPPPETTATKKKEPTPSYQFHQLDEDDEDEGIPAKAKVTKKKDPIPSGKVEMTLELLPELDAKAKPVGKGQDDPNQYPHLDKPNRPATSFLWFTSPFKTLRYIIWRNYKWYIIGALIILILLAAIAIFLYSMPGYTVKKIFKV